MTVIATRQSSSLYELFSPRAWQILSISHEFLNQNNRLITINKSLHKISFSYVNEPFDNSRYPID
jgi:hypothetical protein